MTNEAIFQMISLYKTTKIGHFMDLCESPIEKRFLLSMIKYFETDFTHSYQISYEYDPLEDEELSGLKRSRPTAKILNNQWTPTFISVKNPVFVWRIYPQYQITIDRQSYRIDFLLEIEKLNNEIKKIGIECDGHTYHHQNSNQVNRDNERDLTLASRGITVFRFTSSQIEEINFDKTIPEIMAKIIGFVINEDLEKEKKEAITILKEIIDDYTVKMKLSEQQKKDIYDELKSQLI